MKLTVGKKLGLGFGGILALMLMSAALNHVMSAGIRQKEDATVDVRFPAVETARALQRDLNYTQVKGRQAILAGTDRQRWNEAETAFRGAWSSVGKDVAVLDGLSARWTPEDRSRLDDVKRHLPSLRTTEEAAINHAASGERDAVIRAGNENADVVTPVNIAVKKSLDELAESLVALLAGSKEQLHAANRALNLTMGAITFAALGLGTFVAIFLSRSISVRAQSILGRAQAIAQGDLTQAELPARGEDELADLTRAMNRMQTSLHELIQSIHGTAEQVAASSEEMSATGQKITANSEETTAQARVVSEAGGQVNTNLQTLASGAEEMNSTIGEIAKNATEAARVSGEAVAAADSANQTVSKLGDSSAEIEKVIEVITSIAQQTNLLALNATIEAARAGEAGKGFAVVANEVKELAKQTAKATEEIKQKISAIRENTGGAVTAIGGIKGVIDKVSHISTVIATAVEEQSATTSEMARNVTEAARGAATISSNIQGVAEAAQNTSTNVAESQTAAEHLAKMANQLRDLVGQFKVNARNSSTAHAGPLKKSSHAAGAR